MKLSIIIVTFNTKTLTSRCLESIIKIYKKELQNGEYEIIVVDNASTDGSVNEIKNQFASWRTKIKNLSVIENKENMGFSAGNNIGAKHAKGENLLFLNSDCILQDDGLLRMVDTISSDKSIGILGGKLMNNDGSEQLSAGKFYSLKYVLLMLLGFEKMGLFRFSPKDLRPVDWVSGACLMIKKDIFKKLQGFDENIFMYMEDMELCFRVKKLGLKVIFFSDIKIKHLSFGSSSRSFAVQSIYKGLLYFYKKHKTTKEFIFVKFLLTMKAYAAIIVGIITKNKYLITTYTKAIEF